ncbi:hypothetical protein [Muricauda sp. MAR_2010_75]|uniref:hypothetical protein n=1 Tax=Allomuricauda sp. MAR_2010_75 TaxID=1250232 RepID=UPI00069018E3|nr:hypothetical protein [Muricauda sp. MAR_2010_75]
MKNFNVKIMKNTWKYTAVSMVMLLLAACSSDDKLVDEVEATVARGLVLRTVSINSGTFDFFDTSKAWSVTLEAQDAENGDLLTELDVLMTFINDGEPGSETLVKTIPASSFSEGPFGYPRAEVSATLTEVLSALGLQEGDYDSADSFSIRLVAKLSDGREFTNRGKGTVLNGSFFNSPFAYSAQFFCALSDASLFEGEYMVVADAWADYGGGEVVQAEFLPSEDGDFTFRLPNTVRPFVVNKDSSYLIVTIDATTGNVTVSSNEPWDYGGGFITTVTGDGTIGTCTGDINLSLDFSGSSQNQAFILSKI